MIKETMTLTERLEAAINLEPVDRVPVSIMAGTPFVYKLQGLTAAEAYQDELTNLDRVFEMQIKMVRDLGLDFLHSDGSKISIPRALEPCLPHMRPGAEFPDDELHQHQQVPELEVMREDEYDRLLSIGWDEFWLERVNKVSRWCDDGTARGSLASYEVIKKNPTFQKDKRITWDLIKSTEDAIYADNVDRSAVLKEMGIPGLIQEVMIEPVAAVYFMRTIPGFMHDLYHNYDKVKAVIVDILIPWFLDVVREMCSRPTTKRIHIAAGWFATPMVSKKAFEELQWAWLSQAGQLSLEYGVVPLFHLDSDWTEVLSYFRNEFPKGKYIMQLDGTTDIFNAKKIFRKHACITGDVSGGMLSACSPREVESYCKDLIDIVGEDSGFLLYSGCMVPGMAQIDSVKAMIDTAKNYKGKWQK